MEPKYNVGQYVKINKIVSNDSGIYQNQIGIIIQVNPNWRYPNKKRYNHLYKIQLPTNINAYIWEEEIIIV